MTDPDGERTPRRRGSSRPDPGPTADAPAPPRPPKAGKPGRPGKAGTSAEPGKAGKSGKPGRSGRGAGARSRGAEPAAPRPARGGAEPPVRGSGGQWRMADRSVVPTVLGLPPAAAVGIAAAATAVGVLADLLWTGALGSVFTVCYVSGCVLAVAWVRRSGLFGPVVQPPLLVAVSVPVVVLLAGSPGPGEGLAERLLTIAAPLVNAFPVMAMTTGAVLLLGLLRVVLQRPLR